MITSGGNEIVIGGNKLVSGRKWWGLCRFQQCTGRIMTGSWKGRRNQYIQWVKVLYCKLPTNGKQLPAFPLDSGPGTEHRQATTSFPTYGHDGDRTPAAEVGGENVTALPPWPLISGGNELVRGGTS